jgi:predicted ArsR family transcriptional regulator
MGGEPELPTPLQGIDGRRYYPVADAATLLGMSPDGVRNRFDLLLAKNRVELPKSRGRPSVHVIEAEKVDEERRCLLTRLGVADAASNDVVMGELRDLRRRVRELESLCAELATDYAAAVDTANAQSKELAALRQLRVDDVTAATRGELT